MDGAWLALLPAMGCVWKNQRIKKGRIARRKKDRAGQTDLQHGQAGSAGASPKFCSATLRKTSAMPAHVVGNLPGTER